MAFGTPPELTTLLTKVGEQVVTRRRCRPTQRQIVTALCRPYKHEDPYATPATNQQIADEVFLSVDAVKTHLRTLFQKFGIEDLPQNQKRSSSSSAFGSGWSAAGTCSADPRGCREPTPR